MCGNEITSPTLPASLGTHQLKFATLVKFACDYHMISSLPVSFHSIPNSYVAPTAPLGLYSFRLLQSQTNFKSNSHCYY